MVSSRRDFVQVSDGCCLSLNGEPYRFVGANLWYGAALGSPGRGGDRARLARELDRLARLGATNLRVLAGSEGPNDQPWRVVPALQVEPGTYDEDQWKGLDFLLAEMAKRQMKAVMCLSNMWQWSGGFAAYVSWADSTSVPYPGHSVDSEVWSRFERYSARFYQLRAARDLYLEHVRAALSRVNGLTGVPYREDPTIMAWQLANEPRGLQNAEAYVEWVTESTQLIKQLDSVHLVSVGSEGTTPWSTARTCFETVHSLPSVDYATCHVWVQNWLWFQPEQGLDGMRSAWEREVVPYLARHEELALRMNKPLVVEEFGISRDAGDHAPEGSVRVRNEYYAKLFELVRGRAHAGSPLCGTNFWAWSGEGRPRTPGCAWEPGHVYTGDPPHEPQGWYGVYDADESTLRVIRDAAQRLLQHS